MNHYLRILCVLAISTCLEQSPLTAAAGTWTAGKASTVYAEEVQELIQRRINVLTPIPYGMPKAARIGGFFGFLGGALFVLLEQFIVIDIALFTILLPSTLTSIRITVWIIIGILCYCALLFLFDSTRIKFLSDGLYIPTNCMERGLGASFVRFFIPSMWSGSDFIPYNQIMYVDFITEQNEVNPNVQYGNQTGTSRPKYRRWLAIVLPDGRTYHVYESYFQKYGTFERLIGILQLYGVSVKERNNLLATGS